MCPTANCTSLRRPKYQPRQGCRASAAACFHGPANTRSGVKLDTHLVHDERTEIVTIRILLPRRKDFQQSSPNQKLASLVSDWPLCVAPHRAPSRPLGLRPQPQASGAGYALAACFMPARRRLLFGPPRRGAPPAHQAPARALFRQAPAPASPPAIKGA